jgi:1-acyl-sn-glycerol-3-phosphate acyltransferase
MTEEGDNAEKQHDEPGGRAGRRAARALAEAEARTRRAAPPDARTYALAQVLSRGIFGLCTGAKVIGRDRVPREGPLLIVANHLSYLEPPLLAAIIPRRITFLAGHELYEMPWLAPILRAMGALPVRRGGMRDLEALRAAVALLKQGEAVALFPEGRISPEPGLERAKPGLSLLAQRSGAQILPVGISGTDRLDHAVPFLTARWRQPRVRVQIGHPFTPDFGTGRPDHQAIADDVMARIAALLPARYRGEYREKSRES